MKHQRYVLGTFVAAAILLGWIVQAGTASGFAQFAYPDSRVAGLVSTSTLLAVVASGASFAALIRSQQAVRFVDEVVGEVLQVHFPSRDETVRATTTVILTTIFAAGLLAIYDFVWKNVADVILFTG